MIQLAQGTPNRPCDDQIGHRVIAAKNTKAEIVFEGPCFTKEDVREDYGEQRFITYGMLVDRLVVIAHTRRDDKRRIISMRKANDREKKDYQERLETT